MYNWNELKDLNMKPRINDISLEILRQYYENYLYPFIYHYTLNDDKGYSKEIELRFNIENFCHLLGIESIVRRSVSRNTLCEYRGEKGWENIKAGKLDILHLKSIDMKMFKCMKAKFVYFYILPTLIAEPLAVEYDRLKVIPSTEIDCEILLFHKADKDNAIIHLGLTLNAEHTYYVPRTFFVEKVDEKSKDIYISQQRPIDVSIVNRIITI